MVATLSRKRLILPMAPAAGAMIGLAASAVFALIPGDMLGRLILRSGLPAILAAAEPPLGFTARLVLILVGGGSIGLLAWFALFLIVGSRTLAVGGDPVGEEGDPVPVLRRADAHPDAPSRRPVFANRDLGTPFLEVRAPHATDPAGPSPASPTLPQGTALDAIPDDLDLPLSAFDPAAIRGTILSPPAWPAPAPRVAHDQPTDRRQIFEPGERFETFELTRVAPADPVAPLPAERRSEPRDTQATINALLARLERGVTDRAARPPSPTRPSAREPAAHREEGLEQTLGTLRRMATRS